MFLINCLEVAGTVQKLLFYLEWGSALVPHDGYCLSLLCCCCCCHHSHGNLRTCHRASCYQDGGSLKKQERCNKVRSSSIRRLHWHSAVEIPKARMPAGNSNTDFATSDNAHCHPYPSQSIARSELSSPKSRARLHSAALGRKHGLSLHVCLPLQYQLRAAWQEK